MATPADYPPIASSVTSADGGGQVSYDRIPALPHCLVSPSGSSSGHITPNVFGSKENLQNNEDNLTKGIDDSIEQAEGEGRELTVKSSIFNLVSTVIGGGVLSLPYTCNRAGIIVAPIILLVIASMSAYSGMLLLSCSKRVRKRRRGEAVTVAAESYEDVVFAAFGERAKLGLTSMVLALTYLATIAYFILLADLLVPIMVLALKGSLDWACNASTHEKRFYVIVLCALLIVPPSLLKDISALRFTSFLSMLSISLLGIAVTLKASSSHFGNEYHFDPNQDITWEINYAPTDISGVLESISIMACAFMCHFNVLPLHRGLRDPTRERLKIMIYVTMGSVWSFYVLISVFGYLEFRDTICDNLLKNYDHSEFNFIMVGQLGLACTLIFSLPLLTHPCRGCIENLMSKGKAKKYPFIVSFAITVSVIFSAAFIATNVSSVVTVWNFLGSTVSIIIGMIAPAACYLRLRDPLPNSATFVEQTAPARLVETDTLSLALNDGSIAGDGSQVQTRGIFEDLNRHRLPAFVLLIVGITLMCACTTQAVISSSGVQASHTHCVSHEVQC